MNDYDKQVYRRFAGLSESKEPDVYDHSALLEETDPLCTCGVRGCDGHSMAHFNRMQEKDQHANEGECGIFSGMETGLCPSPECDNCGMIDEPLSDGYCSGCICARCKKNAGEVGQSMNDMGFCDSCNILVYSPHPKSES